MSSATCVWPAMSGAAGFPSRIGTWPDTKTSAPSATTAGEIGCVFPARTTGGPMCVMVPIRRSVRLGAGRLDDLGPLVGLDLHEGLEFRGAAAAQREAARAEVLLDVG